MVGYHIIPDYSGFNQASFTTYIYKYIIYKRSFACDTVENMLFVTYSIQNS
jgi:hypothetical protein